MKLQVIASSSRGNAYILDDCKGAQLLLECGVQYPRILQALDHDLSRVVGCLVTHEHMDHARSATEIMKAGIDLYTSEGTARALSMGSHRLHRIRAGDRFLIEPYQLTAFATEHDAAEPLGWLLRHRRTGEKLVFATDTYYLRQRFQGVHYFMLECNYCADILQDNIRADRIPKALQNRLLRSHFALHNVLNFLKTSADEQTRKIILMHLSNDNSDAARMEREVRYAAGCEVFIAESGQAIELAQYPF